MQADAVTALAAKPLFVFNAMFDEMNEGESPSMLGYEPMLIHLCS
jgi:hypothetical protein